MQGEWLLTAHHVLVALDICRSPWQILDGKPSGLLRHLLTHCGVFTAMHLP